jgi:ribosomal protein L7/L12
MSTEQEAINYLRSRVNELEDRINYIYNHLGLSHNQNPGMQDARIRELVRSGNKLEAIKLYRELTGAGLAEAKDTIDKMGVG